jgi:hypothetical protein
MWISFDVYVRMYVIITLFEKPLSKPLLIKFWALLLAFFVGNNLKT